MKDEKTQKEALSKAGERQFEIPKPLELLSDEEVQRKRCIAQVTTHVLRYLTSSFLRSDFDWMLPVILSKSTDPLWPDPGVSVEKRLEVEIYEETVRTTLSMIIHKMVACSLAHPRLFILSPNVRIERRDRAATGAHIYEFTQLDFEVRDTTAERVESFVEEIVCGLIRSLKAKRRQELTLLGRFQELKVPRSPFQVHDRRDLETRYGQDWERHLAASIHEPVWVTNIPRQFYDYEDLETGEWDNYDLFLPDCGEVLSGARREWEYSKMISKMERDGVEKSRYRLLLSLARGGRVKPSAGGGIGIERLVRWLVGAKHIGETQTFPKIPGTVYDL